MSGHHRDQWPYTRKSPSNFRIAGWLRLAKHKDGTAISRVEHLIVVHLLDSRADMRIKVTSLTRSFMQLNI